MPKYAQVSTCSLFTYSQLVIGPPGAGKTTYCNGMHQFLGALGRKSSVVNIDAANDQLSYPCAVDVRSLVSLQDIMEYEGLGPNGGIMYALETLEANFEWLEDRLKSLNSMAKLRMSWYQTTTFFLIVLDKWNCSLITTHWKGYSNDSRN